MSVLDEIRKLTPKLTKDEVRTLMGEFAALLQYSPASTNMLAPEKATDIVLQAIVDCLLNNGTIESGKRLRGLIGDRFREHVENMQPLVLQASQRKVGQLAFWSIAIELLCDHLNEEGVVITGPALMQYIGRVPAVLNKNFPGYARSGILGHVLHMIIEEKRHVRKEPGTAQRKSNGR